MPLFNDRAAVGKLQKLFSCMRSQQLHAHAAGGALSRLARKHGYFATKGQGIIIIPAPIMRNDRKLFCDGPAEWLKEHQLYFCRRGLRPRDAGLSNMLMMLIPEDNEALRMTCRTLSVYTMGDLVELKRAGPCWYIPGPLAPLAAYIPVDVPVEQQPLRVGQYWKLSQRHGDMKTDDVIRIDGGEADLVVVAWYRVVIGARPSLVTYTGQRFTTSVSQLFRNSSHVRCQLECTRGLSTD